MIGIWSTRGFVINVRIAIGLWWPARPKWYKLPVCDQPAPGCGANVSKRHGIVPFMISWYPSISTMLVRHPKRLPMIHRRTRNIKFISIRYKAVMERKLRPEPDVHIPCADWQGSSWRTFHGWWRFQLTARSRVRVSTDQGSTTDFCPSLRSGSFPNSVGAIISLTQSPFNVDVDVDPLSDLFAFPFYSLVILSSL